MSIEWKEFHQWWKHAPFLLYKAFKKLTSCLLCNQKILQEPTVVLRKAVAKRSETLPLLPVDCQQLFLCHLQRGSRAPAGHQGHWPMLLLPHLGERGMKKTWARAERQGEGRGKQREKPAVFPCPDALPSLFTHKYPAHLSEKMHMPPPPGSLLWFLSARINHLFIIRPPSPQHYCLWPCSTL